MKDSDKSLLDKGLIQWLKAKHTEIDGMLGIRLASKGYSKEKLENEEIELIFKTVDSKKGGTKIIRYYVKEGEKELKIMEVQISVNSITVV